MSGGRGAKWEKLREGVGKGSKEIDLMLFFCTHIFLEDDYVSLENIPFIQSVNI